MIYRAIDKIIEQNNAAISAAEAHGLGAGLLCMDKRASCSKWLSEVFEGEVDLGAKDRATLEALFERTADLLYDGGFNFDLLLPEDETPINVRVEAFQNWCRGFLLGVGYSGSSGSWSGESGEILKDIVEFTRMDSDVDGEEDEFALAELIEYVRVSVQLINAEFHQRSERQTLH